MTEELISVDGEKFKFDEVLQENNGNYIFINVWASWCKDCIVSLSDLKELQRKCVGDSGLGSLWKIDSAM